MRIHTLTRDVVSFIVVLLLLGGTPQGQIPALIRIEIATSNGAETDSILLSYRQTESENNMLSQWNNLAELSPSVNMTTVPVIARVWTCYQLRLLQLKHGGGTNNCWSVKNLEIKVIQGNLMPFNNGLCSTANLVNGSGVVFCGGSEMSPRGAVTQVFCIYPLWRQPRVEYCGDNNACCPNGSEISSATINFSSTLAMSPTIMASSSSAILATTPISFTTTISTSSPSPFSPLVSPTSVFSPSISPSPSAPEVTSSVPTPSTPNDLTSPTIGPSSTFFSSIPSPFISQPSSLPLSPSSSLIVIPSSVLLPSTTFEPSPTPDVSALTTSMFVSETPLSETLPPQVPPVMSTTAEAPTLAEAVQSEINSRQELIEIIDAPPQQALILVEDLVAMEDRVESVVAIYLLDNILDRFNSTNPLIQTFSQRFLDTVRLLVEGSNENNIIPANPIIEASALNILDALAFAAFPDEGSISTESIIGITLRVPTNATEYITTINSTDFVGNAHPEMSLQVPPELVAMYRGTEYTNERDKVRTVSFLFFDTANLFPVGENNSSLASGIVSTAFQCGMKICPTVDVLLKSPVIIKIQHSEELQSNLTSDDALTTKCVFWEFQQIESLNDTLLRTGQWSDRGCVRNESLSNDSVTVCECNHLTHFAILLSAAPLNVSDPITLSLEIIGYVGVSISLVAMVVTILTFCILKPLRNMRNFIHINLCISLGIAQIIFVAGVDQSSGTDDVPAHCQAIAVLLHYFFLVSFMWMLMEGVVLYVVLVRVFVKNTKRYMLAFTLASYGIPLLYLGVLTIPLGFVLNSDRSHYGYKEACFLSPVTSFILAFMCPVILIFCLNVVLFIIVARVMWKHQKKLIDNTKTDNVKKWLRAAVSLVVIMGLTWIVGVLIVEVEALLPLAYIYTIMVAFQGLWIFLIFVVLSAQVRESYRKWWRAKVNESDFLSKYFGESFDSFKRHKSKGEQSLELKNKNSTIPGQTSDSSCEVLDNPYHDFVTIANNYVEH